MNMTEKIVIGVIYTSLIFISGMITMNLVTVEQEYNLTLFKYSDLRYSSDNLPTFSSHSLPWDKACATPDTYKGM